MQRVATELHSALRSREDVDLDSIILRSSWTWTHVKTGPFLLSALFGIRRRVQAGEVDAVLFSSMVTASLTVFLRQIMDVSSVYFASIAHGRDVTLDAKFYQQFVPRIFDALDAVLPVSRATADACIERGLSEEKLHVVPNGVSLVRFHDRRSHDEARTALRERFGDASFPANGLLLCSAGRQVKRKGFEWFVDAVLPLLPNDIHYWLAGEGPEAESIRAAAKRRNVEDRVRLLGRVSDADLALLYAGSDLFIMPNVPVAGDMEGFGVVMLEAGLSGLPTIASRLEGITDVIREGENGHLLPSGDAWRFSEAIMRYYRSERLLREASVRAASYVADQFSWDAVASQYLEALRAVRSTAREEETLA